MGICFVFFSVKLGPVWKTLNLSVNKYKVFPNLTNRLCTTSYNYLQLFSIFFFFILKIYIILKIYSKGWRSGESARLPPMWPGFKSWRRRHMWVEFVVGSLLCSERFFSGYSGFPLSSKTSISKFQFDQESGRRRTTLWMCYLQTIIYFILFISFFR